LQDDISIPVNITAILQMDTVYGDVFLAPLQCVLVHVQKQVTFLTTEEVKQRTSECETYILPKELRDQFRVTWSTCMADMVEQDKEQCNQARGVMQNAEPLPVPDFGHKDIAEATAALHFSINFDVPYNNFTDDRIFMDTVRSTVAETLGVQMDRVVVEFSVVDFPVTLARRLLSITTGTKATVWVYTDSRAAHKDVAFNNNLKTPADLLTMFSESGGWSDTIKARLGGVPALQFKDITSGQTNGFTEPTTSIKRDKKDDRLTTGAVVAIVSGCVIAVPIILACMWSFRPGGASVIENSPFNTDAEVLVKLIQATRIQL
jgi:hypothetical protein